MKCEQVKKKRNMSSAMKISSFLFVRMYGQCHIYHIHHVKQNAIGRPLICGPLSPVRPLMWPKYAIFHLEFETNNPFSLTLGEKFVGRSKLWAFTKRVFQICFKEDWRAVLRGFQGYLKYEICLQVFWNTLETFKIHWITPQSSLKLPYFRQQALKCYSFWPPHPWMLRRQ